MFASLLSLPLCELQNVKVKNAQRLKFGTIGAAVRNAVITPQEVARSNRTRVTLNPPSVLTRTRNADAAIFSATLI